LASSCWDSGGDSALVTFKAIGNCDDAQLSSQLPDVGDSLLVDRLESCNFVFCILEFLSELCRLVANSGDKPIGHSPDGGTDSWVKSEEWIECKDARSRSWRDWGVLVPLEFDEAGEPFFFGSFFNTGCKGEWEGGSDRRRHDFLNGGLLEG